ncbi:MAG: hypothetical protein Roseis2KO_16270 [Roseivirga sp.]
MQSKTQFNTGHEIGQWKEALQASGHIDQENLMELESHLLDEIDNLQNKGLSDAEVFLVAQNRIGSCATISKAYKKSGSFNFGKNSLLAQAFLLLFTFFWLSKTATFLAGDIAIQWLGGDGNIFVVIHTLLQLLMAGTVYLIYKKISRKNPESIRANSTAICSLVIAIAIHLVYARLSPHAYFQMMGAAPYSVLFSSYLIYLSVFVSILVMNVKQWRKNRVSVAR